MTDGRLGSLLGFEISEDRTVPPGEMYLLASGRTVMVADIWRGITWPLLLADWRRQARVDLNRLVRAAEDRLGLEPSERPEPPARFAPGGTWVPPRRSLADLQSDLRSAASEFDRVTARTVQQMREFMAAYRAADPRSVARITGVT